MRPTLHGYKRSRGLGRRPHYPVQKARKKKGRKREKKVGYLQNKRGSSPDIQNSRSDLKKRVKKSLNKRKELGREVD